jgi:hypothetical protein
LGLEILREFLRFFFDLQTMILLQVMRKCKNEMVQEVVMFFQCVFNVLNSKDLLNDHEDEGTREFVDSVVGVQDVLATIQDTSLLKNLTNFTWMEFEKLANQIAPIISSHARYICEPSWPSKLHD